MIPLLHLPTEVRLNIYRHLIPSIPVHNALILRSGFALSSPPPSLRHDGQPCAAALLRTNRTVYHELVREWYGTVPYEVSLDSRYIVFCGRIFSPYAPLPHTLRFVTRLELRLSLQRTPHVVRDTAVVETLLAFRDHLTSLARCLGDRARRCLRQLIVRLAVNVPLLLSLSKTPIELLELLDWNLAPLRAHVAGLDAVEWELQEQSYGIQSREFCDSYAELRVVMEGFLNEMRLEMLAEGKDLRA